MMIRLVSWNLDKLAPWQELAATVADLAILQESHDHPDRQQAVRRLHGLRPFGALVPKGHAPGESAVGADAGTCAQHALALLAARKDVGIKYEDVNGAIRPDGIGVWSFVLFDSIPGGAGRSRRLREVLPSLFGAARERVEHCDCGEDSSGSAVCAATETNPTTTSSSAAWL